MVVKKKVSKKDRKNMKNMKNMNHECRVWCGQRNNNCSGCGYFLGFFGAAVYYISTATSFGMGVVGFLKALVWPAFLVFELMKFLGL